MTREGRSGTGDPASRIPSVSRLAFFFLCLFGFLTPFIAPAYIVTAPLLFAWIVELRREPRRRDAFRSPFVFLFLVLAILTIHSAVFSRDPAASRITYVIGPDGKIAQAHPKVGPKSHPQEILASLS